MTRRLLVLGRGKFAIDCLRLLQQIASDCPLLVLAEIEHDTMGMSLATYCGTNDIEYHEYENVNAHENITRASAFTPDLCLSLNNFQIIRPSMLAVAREGAINFHNGPLPEYAGVNVCSWAIINGASEYGGTWHFMDEGIDTGAIIARRCFPVTDDATALTLTMQCAKTGLELFEELLPQLAYGVIPRMQGEVKSLTYYSKKDIPFGMPLFIIANS